MLGELIPKGGGDPIPLLKDKLMVGRRESCDIVLRFANVSAHHCQLTIEGGYWFVKDLNSRNGTRVNGYRVTKRRVDPGDILSVGKHEYKVQYTPTELGAGGAKPPDETVLADILEQSLLESAGLSRQRRQSELGMIGLRRHGRQEAPSAAGEAGEDSNAPQDGPDEQPADDPET